MKKYITEIPSKKILLGIGYLIHLRVAQLRHVGTYFYWKKVISDGEKVIE